MVSIRAIVAVAVLIVQSSLVGISSTRAAETLEQHVQRFAEITGAKLVFEARDLPPGKYHDIMLPLDAGRRVQAAQIACREMQKLPPGYLRKIGLDAIGVFAGCASREQDGFHTFDDELGGYRYYGIYNGKNAIAAAYYSDEQLPLTLHHEVFHHVDRCANEFLPAPGRDSRRDALAEIVAGRQPYPRLKLADADLAALRKLSQGQMLIDSVSEYAAKNPAEDAAETARYLMSRLPDSLCQMAERPQLAGSQRLLHVLETYSRVPDERGPNRAWFVALALRREQAEGQELQSLVARMASTQRKLQAAAATEADFAGEVGRARNLLDELEKNVAQSSIPREQADGLVEAAALLTHEIVRATLRPRDDDRQFTVRGHEDSQGINWTLRKDIAGYGSDAIRLQRIIRAVDSRSASATKAQLQSLRLVARFYGFIAARWPVTNGTGECFESARSQMLSVVALSDAALAVRLSRVNLTALADAISADGVVRRTGALATNPYLASVDREIEDPKLRKTIRRVQPACVRLNRASGVNLSSEGLVLTAAHVAERLQQEMIAEFPDGTTCPAVCIAIDHRLDVALCRLTAIGPLPYATVAAEAPKQGDRVVCIGQPGTISPRTGEPTGYEPFNVSVGQIRGFAKDRLAGQTLGGTKHDAWTYWGHSGSPLFNDRGEIVAMHNSWDQNTAMRHAVTHEAIVKFLRGHDVAGR